MQTPNNATAIIQEARICLLAGARIKDSADPSDAMLVLLSGPLSELHGTLFEPAKLSDLAKAQFGWEISAEAIEFFIPKMRSLGWLDSRTDFPARGPFYVNLPEPDLTEQSGLNTSEALATLGVEFREFAKTISPFQSLPDDPMEAGAVLLRYVVDTNLPLLANNRKAQSDDAFLAARFVEHVNHDKLPARETLASLSAVGFLFRVAEEITHPSQRRRVDLKIVVDGPIILDYLGCSGPLRSETSNVIFEQLRDMGAQTVTFEHCLNEARDALKSVLKANPRDRYGPTGDALRKGIVNENALLAMLQAFDVAITSKLIHILPDDIEFTPQSHKFFSDDRAKAVEQIVNWHEGFNDNARYADSDTTALTIRRRLGHRTTDIFASKFVCVTTNEVFAMATKRHLLETAYYNARQVPPIVSLKELAAKLWIEVGNSAKNNFLSLPNSQLLLSCDRALRFNLKIVEKARSELAKVRPEQLQQFELLLEVPRSARAVMDVTLNNEKYVSGDTVEQLVEAAVEAAGAEVGVKARALRARDQQKFRAELAEAEKKIETEQARALEDRQLAERERAAREEADESMLEAVGTNASRRFKVIRFSVRMASVAVAVLPLGGIALALWNGVLGPIGVAVGCIPVCLAAATAMDRPGAWLSQIISGKLEESAVTQLRNVGRHDLASLIQITWKDGIANTTLSVHDLD
ncbi:hypothetical protein [Novosphingobium lentum]|uniref:hypothetical protein n=1 Tax=Novosphingobium lentum TaxID=145287 RepID=UPI000B2C80E9|nr:hypothetical protein [Novosphingobium lentum]